jgi:hypothetical protein
MKLRLFASLLLVALMFAFTTSAQAQAYTFAVDRELVNVYWNADGTMALDYVFFFTNDIGGHVIDYVDVGMPTANFSLNEITADVNGNAVSVVSDFQGDGPYGFAVDAGAYAIQPGQSGQVHVYVASVRYVLHESTDDPEYASAVFSPAYWTTAHGSTDMTVIYHLPPGVQPDEPRYYNPPEGFPATPEAGYDDAGRITYTWRNANANAYSVFSFGAAFPKSYVAADAIVTTPPPGSSINLGGIISGIFSSFSTFGFICCFGLIFVVAPIMGAINERKRKLQYMSPKISIEGHGIKRGLTAVESAILMEQPLDKIMTMILFGVVKKNAAEVVKRDPLELRVTTPMQDGLHEYEVDFLAAFTKPDLAARRKDLQELVVKLVKSVGDKMKGFSGRETKDYYKAIMEKAWQQIETAGTPEVKSQMYDEAIEWTMLDRNYDERTRRVFTGPVFLPMWWGRYDPGYQPASIGSVGGARPGVSVPGSTSGGRTSVPGAAFAASVVGSVQGFSSRVLGDVKSFTSGVTNRTNPVPKTSSSGWKSGGGGGGHSCACACACAGCACACAGGGR